MKRFFLVVAFVFGFLIFPKPVRAAGYEIENFESEIAINQDTSVRVEEKIEVNFWERHHGIYRTIPVNYTARGRTINSRLKVEAVTDESGGEYEYQTKRQGRDIEIKIGDPDVYVLGKQVYVIQYQVEGVIQRFEEHDELYWNVTGSGWESDIEQVRAVVKSDYAKIKKIECFECSGLIDSEGKARFESVMGVGRGMDLTIVVGLEKENQLMFPGLIKRSGIFMLDNWGYLAAGLPLVYMGLSWYKKGRDKRYLTENVYYEPDDKSVRTVPVFKRAHLPMVYSPIDNLTPGEMGVIVDERVDMRDVVAEIVELARLKYIKIEMVEKKKLVGKRKDYVFKKLKEETEGLRDYQVFLVAKLFAGGKEEVKLDELKNKFYKHLGEFRKKLYKEVNERGYFDGDPDKVRIKWLVKYLVVEVVVGVLLFGFLEMTGNYWPWVVWGVVSVVAGALVFIMPRKTAKGYALHRQAKGLSYFVRKGKWRHEVAEKRLFFEEMLPLAISLGVVKKLAKDMEGLGVKPPSYFGGASNAVIYSNLSGFESNAGRSLVSSPKGSGGWSGGSGFGGGGFSGGGFGGGGGGGW